MNDSIQILNKNGDMMSVEGIAHVAITDINKKYLFYTLNEKVDNDLTKIYIAEASDVQGGANPINDEEWDNIRKKMVKISHKEELPDVSYLPFGENTINVGEAKKLAVTSVAKQAFKEAQATHTISTNQTETPVVNGTPSFFAPATDTDNQDGASEGGVPNIFTNPPVPEQTPVVQEQVQTQPSALPDGVPSSPVAPTPEVTNVAPTPEVVPTTEITQETPAPVVENTSPVASVEEIPAVETPTQIAPQQEVIPSSTPDASAVPAVEPIIPESTPEIEETPAVAPAVTEEISTQTTNNEQKEIISDEDALKAIEVIQDYIAQEEAA